MSADFICQTPEEQAECARTCVGVEQCSNCHCAVIESDAAGPWGDFMDVFLGLLPIFILLGVTVKKNPWPTTQSLPFAAAVMFLVRTMYYGSDPLLAAGCIIKGVHEAWTPLSIMAGAIFLFETLDSTYCMPYMIRELKALTHGHPVAECMVLFSFATMVEGASGFGTPAALSTPMLVSMGHSPLESVVLMLVLNTFATVWGAVGTPIWFGYQSLGLSEDDFLEISNRASIVMSIAAFIMLPWVLTILVPWSIVRRNIVFVVLATAGTVIPSLGLSFISYEFPSLLGGVVGCFLTAVLTQLHVGLVPMSEADQQIWTDQMNKRAQDAEPEVDQHAEKSAVIHDSTDDSEELQHDEGSHHDDVVPNDEHDHEHDTIAPVPKIAPTVEEQAIEDHLGPRKPFGLAYVGELLLRILPILGVVMLLILTRVEVFGIKDYLTRKDPYFEIVLGTWGIFRLSSSLVFQLNHIMTYPNLNWDYAFFYVPFFMPFIFVSLITFVIFRNGARLNPIEIGKTTVDRLKGPAVALVGALILVQLMIRSGTAAPAFIIGSVLADWFQEGFVVISPLIGALGSFFSGSTTVSNLTFGGIQLIAAESIGVSGTAMLALQAVGASAGNGICLNNIIATCAVVGLNVGEGQILARTARYVFSLTSIATVLMLAFFFRF